MILNRIIYKSNNVFYRVLLTLLLIHIQTTYFFMQILEIKKYKTSIFFYE